MKIRSHNTNDGPTELRDFSPKSTYAGPDEFAGIPEVAGAGQYCDSAKIIQRSTDHPKMKSVLKGHITVNEYADSAEDGTDSFNGYVSDV